MHLSDSMHPPVLTCVLSPREASYEVPRPRVTHATVNKRRELGLLSLEKPPIPDNDCSWAIVTGTSQVSFTLCSFIQRTIAL